MWCPSLPQLWCPSLPQHRCDLVEATDARVHLHRLVEAVGVSGGVAAPAAFAHHDGSEVEVEGLADARLDAANGRAPADAYDVARQHVQKLRATRALQSTRAALEEDVILGKRRNLIREVGLCRAFNTVGEWRHA